MVTVTRKQIALFIRGGVKDLLEAAASAVKHESDPGVALIFAKKAADLARLGGIGTGDDFYDSPKDPGRPLTAKELTELRKLLVSEESWWALRIEELLAGQEPGELPDWCQEDEEAFLSWWMSEVM